MTRYTALVAALTLAACAPPSQGTGVARLTAVAACLDPVAYGAIAGDGLPDRVAFQVAVDAADALADGGTVCVGPGRWRMERAPVGSYDRFAGLSTHGHHVTIRGAGPETVLELVGDQGASAVAVIAVDPGAEHVRISDLTIDTTAATNTEEQTHAIGTGTVCSGATCAPIRDLLVERVTFRHPRNTTSRKGDCVRAIGNTAATAVIGMRVVGNHFDACARSAIQIQRFVTGLVIANNTFTCADCDQTIDGEATGGGWDDNLTITGNTILDQPGVQGDYSIALTNTNHASITGNTMNRGIALYRTTMTVVSGNAIDATFAGDYGVIDAQNVCEGLVVTGNTLRRTGHVGPLVGLAPHSGGYCAGVSVVGNNMTQGTAFHAVTMSSMSRAVVASNLITYAAAAPGFSAIYTRAVNAGVESTAIGITGNVISGPVTYAVTLDASPGTFGRGVAITNNTATGTTWGLRLNNSGFTVPPTCKGNSFGPSAYGSNLVSPGD